MSLRLQSLPQLTTMPDMQRTPEPELMVDATQAKAYAQADFSEPHENFVRLFGSSLLAAYTADEIREQLDRTGLDFLATRTVSDRHVIVYGVMPA